MFADTDSLKQLATLVPKKKQVYCDNRLLQNSKNYSCVRVLASLIFSLIQIPTYVSKHAKANLD